MDLCGRLCVSLAALLSLHIPSSEGLLGLIRSAWVISLSSLPAGMEDSICLNARRTESFDQPPTPVQLPFTDAGYFRSFRMPDTIEQKLTSIFTALPPLVMSQQHKKTKANE
ncbi:hypothetical protein R1flu_020585 [Riccia fluitans]|uniref:Secreted protein n=1 Tax=Riccia fluitans TaxID=41844 RepID=A0ABD1ZLX5_9MARC